MREDRIVSRSKDGHRYKKKKTVPVLVPIIAAGIIAVKRTMIMEDDKAYGFNTD